MALTGNDPMKNAIQARSDLKVVARSMWAMLEQAAHTARFIEGAGIDFNRGSETEDTEGAAMVSVLVEFVKFFDTNKEAITRGCDWGNNIPKPAE